jgi:hypothetical protein
MSTAALFNIGVGWEDVSDRERLAMKEFIGRIVGYPCKVACKAGDGIVDVYVMSDKTGRIEDWIEIHENGAIWPIEEMYEEKKRRLRDVVLTACNRYNDENGVEVPECDEDEDEDEEEDEESQEESHAGTDEEEESEDESEEGEEDEEES